MNSPFNDCMSDPSERVRLYESATGTTRKGWLLRGDSVKGLDGLTYGPVNVRTDGRPILCATMNEGDSS